MNGLFPLGSGLHLLGLALMAGGMLALGAFTAPALFKSLPRPEAAEAMTLIFRRFDLAILWALGLVIVGEALRMAATGRMVPGGLLPVARLGLMALLTVLTAVSVFMVNPRIEAWQNARKNPQVAAPAGDFQKTHQLSESLYRVELLIAVLLILLTPFAEKSPA